MIDFFLYLILGLTQIAMAVWGGIVSTKSLPSSGQTSLHARIFYAMGFFGLLSMACIGWNNHQVKEEDRNVKQSLSDQLQSSLQRQEYMRGQLESISVMIGKVGERSTDPVVAQLAGAVIKMADNARAATPSRAPVAGMPSFSSRRTSLGISLTVGVIGAIVARHHNKGRAIGKTPFFIEPVGPQPPRLTENLSVNLNNLNIG
jgi:hypothetical protein